MVGVTLASTAVEPWLVNSTESLQSDEAVKPVEVLTLLMARFAVEEVVVVVSCLASTVTWAGVLRMVLFSSQITR